jgi:hypothetical protein
MRPRIGRGDRGDRGEVLLGGDGGRQPDFIEGQIDGGFGGRLGWMACGGRHVHKQYAATQVWVQSTEAGTRARRASQQGGFTRTGRSS